MRGDDRTGEGVRGEGGGWDDHTGEGGRGEG